jgi:hypothetical protein
LFRCIFLKKWREFISINLLRGEKYDTRRDEKIHIPLVKKVSSLSTDSKGRKKSIVDKSIEIINEGCFIDLIIYKGVIGKRKSSLFLLINFPLTS